MNSKLDERFYKVSAFVSATSYETLCIWREYHEQLDYTWEQDNMGLVQSIGNIHGEDVRVSFFWNKIGGKLIAFYEPSSNLFSYNLMMSFIESNFPEAEHTNAMNVHNVIGRSK